MLLGEPQRTPYDLNFPLLGTHVRVAPFFWLAAIVIGQNAQYMTPNGMSMNYLLLMGIWVAAMFLSILIHEMGHVLAFRRYGINSHVVLYHFGGLAVPSGSLAWQPRRMDPYAQIFISAAGPAANLLTVVLIVLMLRAAGHQVPLPLLGLREWFPEFFTAGDPVPNAALNTLIAFILYPSFYWALLNLLPIYPLDGGQISRELFLLYARGAGIRYSLILSLVLAGGIAVWALSGRNFFLGIMFGMLAYSSYQALDRYSGRGGYGGGNPW